MNSIDIRHPHSLTKRQARMVLDTLVSEFSARHGAGYRWEDDALAFSRFGMRGRIELLPGELHIRAALGFLYLSRRDSLVAKVMDFLTAHEDTKDPKVILASARRLAAVSPHDRPTAPPKPAPKSAPKARAKKKTAAKTKPPSRTQPSSTPASARRNGNDEE